MKIGEDYIGNNFGHVKSPNIDDDNVLASFSAAGPTHNGFVKPDLVAPGGHVWSLMPDTAQLVLEHP